MTEYYTREDIPKFWAELKKRYPEIQEIETMVDNMSYLLRDKEISPVDFANDLSLISSLLIRIKDIGADYESAKHKEEQEVKDQEADYYNKLEGSIEDKKRKARIAVQEKRKEEAIVVLLAKKIKSLCDSAETFITTSQTYLKWKEKEWRRSYQQ